MTFKDSIGDLFGYDPVSGPQIVDLVNLNKDEDILSAFNDTDNIFNSNEITNTVSVSYAPTNSITSTKVSSNNQITAEKQFNVQGEVSTSAYIFVLLEFIKMVVVDCTELEDHDQKLREIGEDVGFKLLELVKFKSTVPAILPTAVLNEKLLTYKHTSNIKNSSSVDISQTPKAVDIYKHIFLTSSLSSKNIQTSNTSLKDLKKLSILEFIHGPIWRYMFGKKADDIQQLKNNSLEYIIIDNDPLLSSLVLTSQINEFICGIIKSCVVNSGFECFEVTAHVMEKDDPDWPNKTVYVIKFVK
ncbi:hypothetical protein QEN19_001193 [Hanseniaspora menglaensis]